MAAGGKQSTKLIFELSGDVELAQRVMDGELDAIAEASSLAWSKTQDDLLRMITKRQAEDGAGNAVVTRLKKLLHKTPGQCTQRMVFLNDDG